MEDYEIRDVMNRSKAPDIELIFSIEQRSREAIVKELIQEYNPYGYNPPAKVIDRKVKQNFPVLIVRPQNKGRVIAEHVHIFIEIPDAILADSNRYHTSNIRSGYTTIANENVYRDILGFDNSGNPILGAPRVVPILPEITGTARPIELMSNISFDDREITWKVYADTAPYKSGFIKLRDLKKN